MTELRFDNRVAVITGAGRGLGRSYALLLASRGAKVVVNDIGVTRYGADPDESPAQDVVNEIRAMGGEAVANTDSVSTAVTRWPSRRIARTFVEKRSSTPSERACCASSRGIVPMPPRG